MHVLMRPRKRAKRLPAEIEIEIISRLFNALPQILCISAGLIIVISLGGWDKLLSASVGMMSLMWAGLYILFAVLVARWNRGILPVV